MSVKVSLSGVALEEVYNPATLKEMCVYKCLSNKEILTKKVEVADENLDVNNSLDWEKYRLKEPIQPDLLEALLDAGDEYMFRLTAKYVPVIAAIRMSQPEHLVKVNVSNTDTLEDRQLEFLLSGGNIKSLDIHRCWTLTIKSLDTINKFGSKLEYLRIGDCNPVLPSTASFDEFTPALRTPNLKTFIVYFINCDSTTSSAYWRHLLMDFVANLEELHLNRIETLESLDFLEPARDSLQILTLSKCMLRSTEAAWATLFEMHKLRFLDLLGSSIETAIGAETVLARLLNAMPMLTHLAVDRGLVKGINVKTNAVEAEISSKRLQFLGIMDKDEDADEFEKAILLANDVAHFGTTQGEWRALQYFSNRVHSGVPDLSLEKLLKSLTYETQPWIMPAIISLLLKTFQFNGVLAVTSDLFFTILKNNLRNDIVSKLGEVFLDHCINTISGFIDTCSKQYDSTNPKIIIGTDYVLMRLYKKLRVDHYRTVVPGLMRLGGNLFSHKFVIEHETKEFLIMLNKVSHLLERMIDRFPEETTELWGIASVLVMIKNFFTAMRIVKRENDRVDLVEIFSNLISSLRKLCVDSGPRRAAFRSDGGVACILELLRNIIDGYVPLTARDCSVLLEIVKLDLEDGGLDHSDFGMIAADLETMLLSVRFKLENGLLPVAFNGISCHTLLDNIASLLKIIESAPMSCYKTTGFAKEILMNLKL